MTDSTKKKMETKCGAGTDWNKLRSISPASIRRAIISDPDAHITDENFWKGAKVVQPPERVKEVRK